MTDYPFTLEKGSKKYTCPACGGVKRFRRVVSGTGEYLPESVGVCDRVNSCGYKYTWGQYFQDNPSEYERWGLSAAMDRNGGNGQKRRVSQVGLGRKNVSQAIYGQRFSAVSHKRPDFIDKRHLLGSLSNYAQNAFVQFLFDLFPFDAACVLAAVNEYKLGTGSKGETIFWQIDMRQRIRTGKLIAYDSTTGKRRKDRPPNWVHAGLKKAGQLPDSFELQQCFFGEHLLSKYPNRAIAIVEAEKTAVVASICKRVFPDLVWLACGGLSNLKADKLERIGHGRKILLFPDLKAFDKWQAIASDARKRGIAVHVSDLLETLATSEQKDKGLDLADYLIEEQQTINADIETMWQELIATTTIDGVTITQNGNRFSFETNVLQSGGRQETGISSTARGEHDDQ